MMAGQRSKGKKERERESSFLPAPPERLLQYFTVISRALHRAGPGRRDRQD